MKTRHLTLNFSHLVTLSSALSLVACGGGGDSAPAAAAVTDTAAPIMVSLTATQPLAGQVTLTAGASDNIGVTGYCFATNSTKPTASDSCFQTQNTKTLALAIPSTPYYVWAKDAVGNVSSTPRVGPCSSEGYATSATATGHTVCILTSVGEMVLALQNVKAPITSANFLKYVNSGYFSGTVFHRVITGFVAQGGGFTYANSVMTAKTPSFAPITLETTKITGLSNTAGTITMARTSAADSATSQYFFNLVDNSATLDAASAKDGLGYAVFGQLSASSIPTLTAIKNTPVTTSSVIHGETSQPITPPVVLWSYQLK